MAGYVPLTEEQMAERERQFQLRIARRKATAEMIVGLRAEIAALRRKVARKR